MNVRLILLRRAARTALTVFAIQFALASFWNHVSNANDFQKVTSAKPATLVCVISKGDLQEPQNMDAVVIVENGKLKHPYAEYNEAAQTKFANQYFRTGAKYRVTFGGGEVGSAIVKSSGTGCNNIHASAMLEDSGRIPPRLSGLATNSDHLGRQPSARRAPTQEERAAMMDLVNRIYRSHQTPRNLLRLISTTNMTATDLNGDGKFEMIGSFVLQTVSKARRDLFVIADPVGKDFKVVFEKFQSYRLPPEQFDSAIDFVDQLDLDGDGVGEVFVQQHGFDAYGYSIYKRVKGRWTQVFTATGDAC
jgi:hypothetical protein